MLLCVVCGGVVCEAEFGALCVLKMVVTSTFLSHEKRPNLALSAAVSSCGASLHSPTVSSAPSLGCYDPPGCNRIKAVLRAYMNKGGRGGGIFALCSFIVCYYIHTLHFHASSPL